MEGEVMRSASAALVGTVFLLSASCESVARAATPIKLNGPLAAGGAVGTMRISPDGSRVFYRADQDADELFELFSVPILGGMVVQLNPALVAGGDVVASSGTTQFSPDGSRVLYVADQDVDEVVEIYSVPSGGGMSLQHNGALVAGGDVNRLADNQFTPDGSRVVYVADQITNDVNEIFSVLTTGGTTIKLSGALVAGGDAGALRISPNGSRVLYQADQITDDVFEIFSVPITGGTPVKLNGTLVAGGDVDGSEDDLRFTPDGTRVVFRADQNTDEVFEVFSVPSAGGTAVTLNGPLAAGGSVESLDISPNSSRVAYVADQDTDQVFELYSVPIGGGTPVKLNGPLVSGGDVEDLSGFLFSPDSSRVLYIADEDTNGTDELFSVPSGGGASVKLNGPLVSGGDVSSFDISPDSSRVIYRAEQDTNGVDELYSVPIGGFGTPVKLNLPGDQVQFGLEFSPDSSRFLYYASQAADGPGFYLVPSTGGTTVNHDGATPVKVSGEMVAGGSAFTQSGSAFTPDGSIIVYTADQDTLDMEEAYARIVRQHSVGAGGSWDVGATWTYGVVPDEVMQVFIDGGDTVTATGIATVRAANELQVGNGVGTARLTLASNAVITAINGVSINAGGEVQGDGQIIGDVAIDPLGELRAGSSQQLLITGDVLSEGDIVASGTSATPAEIEFDGGIENFELIAARLAVLRFNNGLYSEGDIFVTTGATEVFGDVNNQGTTQITDNAFVTFHDDYRQDATLIVEKSGASAGTAVFRGDFTGFGGGSGGGNIVFEGDVHPGNNPATVDFANNVSFTQLATLHIELGGTTPGLQYDQVQVTGNLSLDGALIVSLINGFSPVLGNSFDILDWTSLTGAIDSLSLPALSAGLAWDFSQLHTTGVLTVVPGDVPGDYNDDGNVDAADYVLFRKFNGTFTLLPNDPNPLPIDGDQYNTWRGNFGQSGGAGGESAVPEPSAALWVCLLLIAAVFPKRRG
jgi:Tol biopolymer transport system component